MNSQSNQSRRNFLKASATAAGAAMPSGLVIPRAVHAAGGDAVKIALVGCGGRRGGAAVNALSTSGQAKLIAVADAFEDTAKGVVGHLKNQFGEKVDVPGD